MKNWIIKLLSNKLVRRAAGALAVFLLAYAPELDVAQATEVFAQILSGAILLIVGKFEEVPQPEVKKLERLK